MSDYEERTYPQRECCDSRVNAEHRKGCAVQRARLLGTVNGFEAGHLAGYNVAKREAEVMAAAMAPRRAPSYVTGEAMCAAEWVAGGFTATCCIPAGHDGQHFARYDGDDGDALIYWWGA